jgi:hypothetical protein
VIIAPQMGWPAVFDSAFCPRVVSGRAVWHLER